MIFLPTLLLTAAVADAGSLSLALVLIGAKLLGELFERFRQPAVLGELAMGILLGNLTLFGGPELQHLTHSEAFVVLAELGAILLLFHVGLESTPREMLAVGGRATLVAVVGVVTPMLLGFGVGWLMHPGESWRSGVASGRCTRASSR